MDKINIQKKEHLVLLILFFWVVVSIPLPIGLNSAAIITFAVYNSWLWFKYKTQYNRFLKFTTATTIIIGISIIGLINTSEFSPISRHFETRIPLVVFSVLLFLSGTLWNKNLTTKVLAGFVAAIVICGLFIQGLLLWKLLKEGESLSYFFYWRNSNAELSERIDIHPTYLSMYAMFSMGIIYEIFLKEKRFTLKVIGGYLIIGYLIVLTLHLASRVSILTLPCVIGMLLVQTIKQHKIQSLWIIAPLLITIVVLFNLRLFALTSRFENVIGNPFELPGSSSSDTRSIAWYSSLEIIKNNFLLGVGTGDATSELNANYNRLDKPFLAEVNLNSHNQFFDSLIRNGVLGLAGLLLLYFYGLIDVRFKSWLYCIFIIVIVFTSLTENILDRQKGVVFFAVFNTLLYRYCKND